LLDGESVVVPTDRTRWAFGWLAASGTSGPAEVELVAGQFGVSFDADCFA
jgi:hypothetical protein